MSKLTRKQFLNPQLHWSNRAAIAPVEMEVTTVPVADEDALRGGGLVLIIGGEKNRWTEFRKHRQLVFWSGDRAEIDRHFRNHDNFPVGVELVITSQFLSHHHIPRIHSEATRKGIRVLKSLSNTRISHLLKSMTQRVEEPFITKMGSVPADETLKGELTEMMKVVTQSDHVNIVAVPPSMPPLELKAGPRGALKKFVWDNLDVDAHPPMEALRLLKLFNEAGFTSTVQSVTRTIYEVRRELGLRKRGEAHQDIIETLTESTVIEPTVTTVDEEETIEMAATAVPTPTLKVPDQSFGARLDGCIQALDDLITQAQLVRAEVSVIKEQIAETDRVREALRTALGFK